MFRLFWCAEKQRFCEWMTGELRKVYSEPVVIPQFPCGLSDFQCQKLLQLCSGLWSGLVATTWETYVAMCEEAISRNQAGTLQALQTAGVLRDGDVPTIRIACQRGLSCATFVGDDTARAVVHLYHDCVGKRESEQGTSQPPFDALFRADEFTMAVMRKQDAAPFVEVCIRTGLVGKADVTGVVVNRLVAQNAEHRLREFFAFHSEYPRLFEGVNHAQLLDYALNNESFLSVLYHNVKDFISWDGVFLRALDRTDTRLLQWYATRFPGHLPQCSDDIQARLSKCLYNHCFAFLEAAYHAFPGLPVTFFFEKACNIAIVANQVSFLKCILRQQQKTGHGMNKPSTLKLRAWVRNAMSFGHDEVLRLLFENFGSHAHVSWGKGIQPAFMVAEQSLRQSQQLFRALVHEARALSQGSRRPQRKRSSRRHDKSPSKRQAIAFSSDES